MNSELVAKLSHDDMIVYTEMLNKIPKIETTEYKKIDSINQEIEKQTSLLHVVDLVERTDLDKFSDDILLKKCNGLLKNCNTSLELPTDRGSIVSIYTRLETISKLKKSSVELQKKMSSDADNIEKSLSALSKWLSIHTEPTKCISDSDFNSLKRAYGVPLTDENDQPLFSSLDEQFIVEFVKNKNDIRTHEDRTVTVQNSPLVMKKFETQSFEFVNDFEIPNRLFCIMNTFTSRYHYAIGRAFVQDNMFKIEGYVISNLLNGSFEDVSPEVYFGNVDENELIKGLKKKTIDCYSEVSCM